MAAAALGRAAAAAGGTLLVLGGGTIVVSTVTTTIAKLVLDKQKEKKLITCRCCGGRDKMPCDVCQGERVLRYMPSKTLPVNRSVMDSACAMCEGRGEQVCLNCLGEGRVLPLGAGLQECLQWLEPDTSSSSTHQGTVT